MSTATNVSEKVIASVIDHQFLTLIEKMSSCNSLEISGFGKFLFHKNKAPKRMITYIKEQQEIIASIPELDIHARKRAEIKLSNIQLNMNAINQKLQTYENQFCTNMGGVEKPVDSSPRDEGAHSRSSK